MDWHQTQATIWSKMTRYKRTIGLTALVVVIGCSIWAAVPESTASFQKRFTANFSTQLQNPENPICKIVEDAHLTVKAKNGVIQRCVVRTIDGSNRAGRHGDNIGEVYLVVTVYWAGLIQQNGYTEISFSYDPRTKLSKDVKFLRSNAQLNIKTTDWIDVGMQIGTVLAPLLLVF